MGCAIDDPGESKLADTGVSLPGTGETPVAPAYIGNGRKVTLKGGSIAAGLLQIVEDHVKTNYYESGARHRQSRAISTQPA